MDTMNLHVRQLTSITLTGTLVYQVGVRGTQVAGKVMGRRGEGTSAERWRERVTERSEAGKVYRKGGVKNGEETLIEKKGRRERG